MQEVSTWLQALALFVCVLLAVYLGDTAVAVNSTYGDRELPIYCVETDKKQVAISFDAAWGNDDTETLMTGYTSVAGKAELVDSFVSDKEVIGSESMSVFKTTLIKGVPEEIPEGLTCEQVNLQKLFYFLTGGSPDAPTN